tara:strand:- start:172 stop:399 length:228 start_codon:yes stop_codon:yes gene_type:complete
MIKYLVVGREIPKLSDICFSVPWQLRSRGSLFYEISFRKKLFYLFPGFDNSGFGGGASDQAPNWVGNEATFLGDR